MRLPSEDAHTLLRSDSKSAHTEKRLLSKIL